MDQSDALHGSNLSLSAILELFCDTVQIPIGFCAIRAQTVAGFYFDYHVIFLSPRKDYKRHRGCPFNLLILVHLWSLISFIMFPFCNSAGRQ